VTSLFTNMVLERNATNRRRRPSVAPERPSDAPPIDYGGRHPFDDATSRRRWLKTQTRGQQESQGNSSEVLTHKPIRIHFDTSFIEDFLKETLSKNDYITATRVYLLLYYIIPKTVQLWENVLKVIPVQGIVYPLTLQKSTTSKLPHCPANKTAGIPQTGVDLWMYATLNQYRCNSSGTEAGTSRVTVFGSVASSTSCERDQFDRPITGSIDVCLERMGQFIPIGNSTDVIANLTSMMDTTNTTVMPPPLTSDDPNYDVIKKMIRVITHEMGHVLGVTSDSLPFFRHAVTGKPLTPRPLILESVECRSGEKQVVLGAPSEKVLQKVVARNGLFHYEVTSPLVQRVVRNHFNCPSTLGLRLENLPAASDGCFGSHFDERLYYSELMGAYPSPIGSVLSPLTLAFLEDTSWYRANYESPFVSVIPFGYLAGCDFVDGNCIVNGAVPDYGTGNFCTETITLTEQGFVQEQALPQTCDPSYRYKAFCDLRDAKPGEVIPPAVKEYFGDVGAKLPYTFSSADYCPIPSLQITDCTDPTARFIVSQDHLDSRERFGPNSKCIDVTTRDYSICLEAYCNEKLMKLQLEVLYGINVTCLYDGQIITLIKADARNRTATPFKIKCPRLAQACPHLICPNNCAGRGECMYDKTTGHGKCRCLDFGDKTVGCYDTPLEHVYRSVEQMAISSNNNQANLLVFLLIMGSVLGILVASRSYSRYRADRLRHSIEPDEHRGWREILFGKRHDDNNISSQAKKTKETMRYVHIGESDMEMVRYRNAI